MKGKSVFYRYGDGSTLDMHIRTTFPGCCAYSGNLNDGSGPYYSVVIGDGRRQEVITERTRNACLAKAIPACELYVLTQRLTGEQV